MQVLGGYAVQETGQFHPARTNRSYHYVTTLLTYINCLIHPETDGLHDTAWDAHRSAVTPFLNNRTHYAHSNSPERAVYRNYHCVSTLYIHYDVGHCRAGRT